MFLSPRSSVTVRPWRTLLVTLAFTTAGAHAQEQTARLVKDANATQQGFNANIDWVKPIGANVVFPMDTIASGKELWISDGTAKGTRILKDIVPGAAGSRPLQGTTFGTGANAKVAFLTVPPSYLNDAGYPPELDLWVTDGTAAGTVRVLESPFPLILGETTLRAGTTNGVFLEDKTRSNGTIELFFSDGTAAGTRSLNPLVGDTRKFTNPSGFYTTGQWCYFTTNLNQVWRSDGTEAGTTKIATLTDLSPREFHVIGDTLFVNSFAQSGVTSELWKLPAAGGTATRVGPPAGSSWRAIRKMNSAGGKLVFVASDLASKPSLWSSDGTEAGTVRIPLILPGQTVESPPGSAFANYQNGVYLFTTQANVGSGLWRTDGTVAGTTFQKLAKSPYVTFDTIWSASDGAYYFTLTDKGYQVWRAQGTPATTAAVKGTPLYSPAITSTPLVAPATSTVYFLSAQGTGNEALVRMKTTKGGSLTLTRPTRINGTGIPSHPVGAPPYQLRNGSILQFVNTARGQEMWQIDPTTGKSRSAFKLSLALKPGGALGFYGTTPAGELFTRFGGDKLTQVFVTNGVSRGTSVLAEDANAYAFSFAQLGNLWFFSPEYASAQFSSTILKSDGTEAGTSVLKNAAGAQQNRIGNMVAYQGALYYISPTADGKKRELWRTDGTPAGTVRVANTWYGDANEDISNLSVAAGKLYFTIIHSGKDHLWQSDGTGAGTVEVSPSTSFAFCYTPVMDLAGLPVFQAQQVYPDPIQWWSINNGTFTRIESPALDVADPTDGLFPKYAVAGSQLFFAANSTTAGDIELWVTNGTTAGTHRVKDIYPGPEGSRPYGMVPVGNYVHFIATNADNGRELWRSDGTDAGTVLAADIEPGPDSSAPYGLKAMGGRLYFSAYRRTTGRELYSVDMPQ